MPDFSPATLEQQISIAFAVALLALTEAVSTSRAIALRTHQIMLFLAPLAVFQPIPAMAGILFVVAWGLFDLHPMCSILLASRQEGGVLLATLAATLPLRSEFAIYIGALSSLMLYLNRTSRLLPTSRARSR